MQKITPFLWFDTQALEAAKFYTSVFKDATINSPEAFENTPSGHVDIITITLLGQDFTLMNAGPTFKINEAISFIIDCEDQAEVDYYWQNLTADGGAESQCGWLKDKYGVSWQVIPRQLNNLLSDKDSKKSGRVLQAMLRMKKIVIKELVQAHKGE